MKVLVLDHLPGVKVEQRAPAIAELSTIYASPANVESSDFPPLVALLREEPFYTPNAKALLQLGCVQIELPGDSQEREIIAVPADRQDLAALRTEMDIHGRSAAAIPADLKRASGGWGGHRQ
jgi:hypothetical protein